MATTISIVTTVYKSAATITEFIDRIIRSADQIGHKAELIIVDDGSPDASADLVRAAVDKDPRVQLVQLSRNFGHHKAMVTGLQHAEGDLVFLIDSDLEEPPELLVSMIKFMNSTPVDCLYGVQNKRKGGQVEKVTGNLFYKLFGFLSDVELPRNVSTVRLMTKRYVRSLLEFKDKNPVFVPLTLLTGYPQAAYPFEKSGKSETTYSIRRRISLMILAITSFSSRPLYLMFYLSLALSSVGLLYGIYVVLMGIFIEPRDGWSSLMAVVVFFFSLNAVFTGLIGLYLKQVLEEVKDRPITVVQEIYRQEPVKLSQGWQPAASQENIAGK